MIRVSKAFLRSMNNAEGDVLLLRFNDRSSSRVANTI